MRTTRTFDKLVDAWHERPRYIASEGGTRSSKTYSALQLFSLLADNSKTKRIFSVVSETMPHLKRGAIRDFEEIMRADSRWDESRWSVVDKIYTFPSGSIIEFFSADSPAKVHGPARDYLFLNECQNIPYEVARQLFVRTRRVILMDYNPTHAFWVHEKIIPRQNCRYIHSTYRDNQFLTPEQIREIEDNRTDKSWWRVYGEGKVGQLAGTIYEFEQIDSLPENGTDIYGLDFGFTNDPTSLVHLKVDTGRKEIYADELCHRTHMFNSDIIQAMKDNDVPYRSVPIYADCAEPKSISEIKGAGFNVIACDKDAPVKSDKLKFQLQWMQGWKLYITKRSLDMIKEARNYTWAKDSDGNSLNYPIDEFNHAMDAMRYAVWSHFGKRQNRGKYDISTRPKRRTT